MGVSSGGLDDGFGAGGAAVMTPDREARAARATVLVTGAGGFIGTQVAYALAAQGGTRLRGATRDGRAVAPGVEPCRLDVLDEASVAGALAGVDAVVHCAVGDKAATIHGTRCLLRQAREAGVRRVVHLSSVSVYGAAHGVVDEATRLISPDGAGYAHWKAAAERACAEAAAADGLDVVTLRPAIVYGAGSRPWITTPAQRILRGVWGGLGAAGRGICNPVHVRDVAAACVAALAAPVGVRGQAFNIAGSERLSWAGWYDRIAEHVGRAPLRDVSPAAWRARALAGLPVKALALAMPSLKPMLQRAILASPARSELALFALDAVYPAGKAAGLLGWSPQITLAAGLAESLAALNPMELAR